MLLSTTQLEKPKVKIRPKRQRAEGLSYLSVVPLLRRIADVWRVRQHVRPIYVIDCLGLWKCCQILVVQHLLS